MRTFSMLLAGVAFALVACTAEAPSGNGAPAKPYDGKTETVVLAVEGMT